MDIRVKEYFRSGQKCIRPQTIEGNQFSTAGPPCKQNSLVPPLARFEPAWKDDINHTFPAANIIVHFQNVC
jgi:hypothetical protein